jgi:hypothetical protein
MCADVSSAPHLLYKGVLVSSMNWRCLLRILCPVRSPITTLVFVLLKNKSLVLALSLGPKINSRTCLCVQPRPRHLAHCWLSNQRLVFLRIFCLETRKGGWGPTNFRTEPSLASLSAVSFPRIPAYPELTQKLPTINIGILSVRGRGMLAPRGLRGPYVCHIVSV